MSTKNTNIILFAGAIIGLLLLKNKKANTQGITGVKTFDVYFNDSDSSNNMGFKESLAYCKKYIRMYNGTNHDYFKDYKGGEVSIVNNSTGEIVYKSLIK